MCRAVSPVKIKIPSKNMREKPKNSTTIHSVYGLCMVAPTCFGILLLFVGLAGTLPIALQPSRPFVL
jgi:hypothetical protein